MASRRRAVQAPTVTPMATVSLGEGSSSSDSKDSSDNSDSSDYSDSSDSSDSSAGSYCHPYGHSQPGWGL